jgi:hypothetical protein
MKSLNAQLTAAQVKKLEAQNRLAASQENAQRLNARLGGLEKQAANLVNESQRQLRDSAINNSPKTLAPYPVGADVRRLGRR